MTSSATPPAEVYRLVGMRIRSERTKRKLTQDDLAQRVNLTRTSITNIEKGRQRILLHTLVQLAAALTVGVHDLISPLDSTGDESISDKLPPNLAPSVKDWILSGVATVKGSSNEHHPSKVHSRTRQAASR